MKKDASIYEVIEYSIGDRSAEKERIVFKTVEDMRSANQDIKDGVDFEVRVPDDKLGNLIIVVPVKQISTKVYEGKITLAAKEERK